MNAKKDLWVVGISASHNGAVCLLRGDEIVVAIQEERLSRIKRQKIYGAQPSLALDYCLDYAGIGPSDLSAAVITVQGRANSPLHDLRLNARLQTGLHGIRSYVISHHYAHALSAFATSGFSESAVLVVDGIGSPYEDLSEDERRSVGQELKDGWEMISLYAASATTLTALEKHMIDGLNWLTPDDGCMGKFRSLGTIFSSSADQIFGHGLDAGKVMGLAPYGKPGIPVSDFFEIIDGRFIFYDKVPERFKHRDRWPLRATEYKDLACSAQAALEVALMRMVGRLHDLCPSDNLCYAGGVALNSVANERIIRESAFKNVYIIPAAEDSGPAIGAAYYGLWQLTGENKRRKLGHDALGREYPQSKIAEALSETPGVEVVDTEDVISATVDLLADEKIIGWFQGGSELGPRALGQRSILCDPRRPDGKVVLNSRVKHREAFRPFAPVALLEEAPNWFELEGTDFESPYMLRVCKFKEDKKDKVPVVVHVDGTGRLQTVTEHDNKQFYYLVKRFYEKTGVPIILNTSFNVMGMPIIETPEDALLCMMSTGIDYCVIENILVKKREKIMLGPEAVGAEPQAIPHPQEAKAAAEQQPSVKSENDFGEYIGKYTHPTGTLLIHQENDHLIATYNGMSTPIELKFGTTFKTTGEIFKGTAITFRQTKKGFFDRVGIQMQRDFGPIMGEVGGQLGEIVFTRAEEPKKLDREFIERVVGRYLLNEQSIEVLLNEDGQLFVTAPGQPHYKLIAGKGNELNLKNTPGYSLEFSVPPSGFATQAVLTQPNGVFILNRE